MGSKETIGKRIKKSSMEVTKHFKDSIWNYLLGRAEVDERIAQQLDREDKSIDKCVIYILNEVKKSGKCGFDDEEIYSMAIHYYDEDIEVGELIAMPQKIVVNETIELSEEEKEDLRAKARKRYEDMLLEELKKKGKKTKNKGTNDSVEQLMFSEDAAED